MLASLGVRQETMTSDKTNLQGLVPVHDVEVFNDFRGSFSETWSQRDFDARLGNSFRFVQDNQSISHRSVLRGLHYQVAPMEQGKLVRASDGVVFDVAVDLRRASPTYGRWHGVVLSGENARQVWIPPGFAHGMLVLSSRATLQYKLTQYYSPDHQRAVRWDDPDIGIEWPLEGEPLLSERDAQAPSLREADAFEMSP